MNGVDGSQHDDRDPRAEAAAAWASGRLGVSGAELEPVSGDASFRRYFRVQDGARSLILMDAPPDKENSAPFVDVAGRLLEANLNAPRIIEFDLDLGFGLLEDFGDTLYRELVGPDSVDELFPPLFDILAAMAGRVRSDGLPVYDTDLLQQELDLFTDWYLGQHRKRPLDAAEDRDWKRVCELLIDSALAQPRVFVHRDFHSCNLLQTAVGPGIIDFQDGVAGPLSYDLVSLIWDRYVAWPRHRLEAWMKQAHRALPTGCSEEEWIRRCDWMGLQRNLKIVGIFARLHYRDGKDGYVEMIPRFYRYLLDVLPRYAEFREFQTLLELDECAP